MFNRIVSFKRIYEAFHEPIKENSKRLSFSQNNDVEELNDPIVHKTIINASKKRVTTPHKKENYDKINVRKVELRLSNKKGKKDRQE